MAKGGFPRGMGGGPNMNQMLKQAQKMQEQMMKMQEELENQTYEASAGGGAVNVKISGKKELMEITLDSRLKEVMKTSSGHDIIARLMYSLGKDESLITKSAFSPLTKYSTLPFVYTVLNLI